MCAEQHCPPPLMMMMMIGLNPGPRARTVKPGPRHLRTRPDPGQNRLGPHKGIPSGEARQCTPASNDDDITSIYNHKGLLTRSRDLTGTSQIPGRSLKGGSVSQYSSLQRLFSLVGIPCQKILCPMLCPTGLRGGAPHNSTAGGAHGPAIVAI